MIALVYGRYNYSLNGLVCWGRSIGNQSDFPIKIMVLSG